MVRLYASRTNVLIVLVRGVSLLRDCQFSIRAEERLLLIYTDILENIEVHNKPDK